MQRIFHAACLFLIAFPGVVRADGLHGPGSPGYNREDPPGTISFDAVKLRVVKAPSMKIPEGCDANYRAGMEGAFRRIWEQCQQIGKSEPSDCQRSLFHRCTTLATDLQSMEVAACTEMHGEKDALDRILKPDNQTNSQVSTSDLNQRAAVASRKVADALDKSAKALASHRARAVSALSANMCSFSSAAAEYKRVEGKLIAELSQNEKFVKTQADAKKAQADQFNLIGAKSASSASQMRSAVAVDSSSPISTYTVHEQSTISVEPTTQTIETTKTEVTTTVTPHVVQVPKPVPFIPYPEIQSNERSIPRWVPILAVGVPAAILGGILISRMSGGGLDPGGDPGNSGGDNSPGDSGSGSSDPGPGPSGGGSSNPSQDPVPGSSSVRSLGMRVDPSFTDKERAKIANAVERIVPCYRYKLKGLEIRKANLGGRRAFRGSCVAGTYTLKGNTIKLDPNCVGIQVGVTVHELFHALGDRNGDALHYRYWNEVSATHRSCPVSRYGASNHIEDFAEAGRILSMQDTRDRNRGACVDKKLAGLRQILASCK